MGNGQSRDEFAGVLPSTKVSGNANSDAPSIAEAWTNGDQQTVENSDIQVPPVKVGKISPPGHALQLKNTSRLSLEANEVNRSFNNAERTEDRFLTPESVRKSQTLAEYADVCSEILPGFLYVSNFQVARNTAKLRALGITHVINCCGELKVYDDGVEQPPTRSGDDFDILKLLLRDDANEDLTPFIPQVMEYIANCRQSESQSDKQNKVLIHCHQGVSRSCAFAVAYVMLEQQLSYHEASALVKRQRVVSSPNAAFICQLLEWGKELQALRSCEQNVAGYTMGLHRLAPHSSYDPEYLVLKRCYEPSAGSVQQRQNVANVRTSDDEHRLLWCKGTFVYQSPTTPIDIIVWQGSNCEIPEAALKATKLVQQILHVQGLVRSTEDKSCQMTIIEVHESSEDHKGTDFDHFGYAAELQWSQDELAKEPPFLLSMHGNANNGTNTLDDIDSDQPEVQAAHDLSVPQLFVLEAIGKEGVEGSWEQLTNYDSDDLTADNAFLLCLEKSQEYVESFVWIGANCNFIPAIVVKAAQKHIQSMPCYNSSPSLVIEHENQESDKFWELFESGY
ncbi:hypothetical protein PHMEG_0003533 [Phytophthora megakarya]|uniref:Dual specificity phosphatase n=1 Tax=Phytophthora megakarya TaxID=4795 RepID=A0A225WXN4_9STRA|nr:hypothetical protein PHMEG_0003533 [Phytophthora megakarya]